MCVNKDRLELASNVSCKSIENSYPSLVEGCPEKSPRILSLLARPEKNTQLRVTRTFLKAT